MGVWRILAMRTPARAIGAAFTAVGLILILLTVLCITIVMAIRSRVRRIENDHSPILTVNAKVVSKRSDVDSHMTHDYTPAYNSESPMAYLLTFELTGHAPLELRVPDNDYWTFEVGDTGRLTYQGTRYEGFVKLNNQLS